MLSPEYLQSVSDGAELIASEIETEIVKAIVERIKIRQEKGWDYLVTSSDVHRMQVLEEAGFVLKDVQKIIAERSGVMYEELRQAFLDAGLKSADYDDETYRKAGLNPGKVEESPYYMRLMDANYKLTAGTWQNFCATRALAYQTAFISALDQAYNLVSTGAMSLSEAYQQAINSVISGPASYVHYASGHMDTLEVATLRALRTGIAKMTGEVAMARMDELDVDLVIVSSHYNARPEHQKWQGKIYSRSGTGKYPDFYSETGYGTLLGLCGVNCRHHFGPYFEGMDNPFPRYNSRENREAYDLSQRQRLLERRIRRTKRDIEINRTLGYEDAVLKKQKLLARQQEAYRDFCKENNLKPQNIRLQIARAEREQNQERIMTARRTLKQSERPAEKPSLPEVFQRDYESVFATTGGMTKEIYDRTINLLDKAPESYAKRLYFRELNSITVGTTKCYQGFNYAAFFDPDVNDICFHVDDVFKNPVRKQGSPIFHEAGHYMDSNVKVFPEPNWDYSKIQKGLQDWFREKAQEQPMSARYKDGLFPDTIRKEVRQLVSARKQKLIDQGFEKVTIQKAYASIKSDVEAMTDFQRHAVSDIMDGATYNKKFKFTWGHSKTYFNQEDVTIKGKGYFKFNTYEKRIINNRKLATEAFAEMMEAHITGPESWEQLKKYLPESCEIFEEIIREMVEPSRNWFE